MSEKLYIFTKFERFWHWSQASLIIFLMLTAFDIHGTYTIFGFEKAVNYHRIAAWSLVGLWVFAIFWHFTTGEWKQYIPSTHNVAAMGKYYLSGIFKGAPHPHRLTEVTKHNPLQKLAYLFILLFVGPLIWITGWLYLFYDQWAAWGLGNLSLELVATGHTIGAFLMLLFLIAHVYLITAGATLTSHIKAMITGWEKVH
ncbi:MAG: cytochrome b/b6 domain-containing protein [Rhodocyclaceae bacterium]|nr:cytochrome b/b6 domain-containing protein [Rhodocyclaceae bacterium]